MFAAASDDRTVGLWDFEKRSILKRLEGHSSWVYCLDFSNCGGYIVSGGRDRRLIIWSTKKLEEVKRVQFKGLVRNAKFQPNGQNLAVSVGGDKIYILDEEFEIYKTCDHKLSYL